MICKIQPPNPDINNAVSYNEKKANGVEGIREHREDPDLKGIEDGRILATRNVPVGSTLVAEFSRLKLENIKKSKGPVVRNTAFHMSVNPSETDRHLSEKEAVALIDELMDRLGYREQPYRIYEHTDTGRLHYHVVSCRIGKDARKINDSFEWLRLRTHLREMSAKYGFEIILSDFEEERDRKERASMGMPEEPIEKIVQKTGGRSAGPEPEEKKQKTAVRAFNRRSETPVTEQLNEICEDALKWNFTTFEQLQALLIRRYNTLIEIEDDGSEDGRIVVFGADGKGLPVTPPLREAEIGVELMRRIKDKCENTKMSFRKEQRKRLETLAAAAAAAAETYEDFCAIMEKKGAYVVVSWTKDGKPFGLTYLDRATKCAWKGSETTRDLSWLKQTAEQKGWTITPDKFQETVEKRNRMPSRRTAVRTKRKTTVGRDPSGQGGERRRGGIHIPGAHHKESTARAGDGKRDSIWKDETDRLEDEMNL